MIELATKARDLIVIQWNLDVLDRTPAGVARDRRRRPAGHRPRPPVREQIDMPVREQLIVELYCK